MRLAQLHQLLRNEGVPARVLEAPAPVQDDEQRRWRARLAGRLTELSAQGASATLTWVVGLIREAQQAHEPAAWVASSQRCFFPPDLASSGVDLAALPVVHAPDVTAAARAAEKLVKSGAFGLVVLDLDRAPTLSMPLQSRLTVLAQTHDTAVVCLTQKPAVAPSIGSLVSLRAEAKRTRLGPGRYDVELEVVKDKRQGPGARSHEVCHAPAGMGSVG